MTPQTASAACHMDRTASASASATSTSPSIGNTVQSADLESLLSQTPCCELTAYTFFVSWQGVLTLAYRGFPQPLEQLKLALGLLHPHLPPESPGSRWPKTSLGCLQEGRRLTPQQLDALWQLCSDSKLFFQEHPYTLTVDHATVVLYANRCLESILTKHALRLSSGLPAILDPPSAGERANVQAVIAEADSPDYWFAASRDGNRENHYRGTALGATLCTCLGQLDAESSSEGTPPLREMIRAFRAMVDEALPDMYTWFSDASLHVTVRALMG